MSKLPKAMIKKHGGDLKAAWADFRGEGHHKKATHHKTHAKHHHSGGGGSSVNASRPGGADLKTTVRSRVVSEIDPSTLGAILYGMFMELDAPAVMDTQDVLPAVMGKKIQTQATAIQSDEQAEWLNHYREEILIGREAVRTGAMGKVLLVLGISSGKGAAHYAQAIRRANIAGQAMSSGGSTFTPPFEQPTVVTSPFGAARPDGFHRGVDLRAAVGTPVRAPWAAKVQKVFNETAGGNVVRLGLQRPDGGYAEDTSYDDDSGILISFLHLDRFAVTEGQLVQAGDVVGYSGNTGDETTGPHLHVMAEFFADKPWYGFDSNSRAFLDPAALYGGIDAIAGGDAMPFAANQVMGGLVTTRDGANTGVLDGILGPMGLGTPGVSSEKPVTVTINNKGALVIGGGTAVNANVKAVLPLGEIGGTGDGGLSNAPVPDALRGVANGIVQQGGSILQGIGSLAGQAFARVVTPEGISAVIHLGSSLAQGAGLLAGILGPAAAAAAPFVAGVAPATGPAAPFIAALATALEVGGPIAAVLGPILGGAGGLGNVLSGGLGKLLPGLVPKGPQSVGDVVRQGQNPLAGILNFQS